jgi:hypothetical protein
MNELAALELLGDLRTHARAARRARVDVDARDRDRCRCL